ncbi:MAG: dihydropteroate synthase [Cocleimonas sp.]|nr:dihydropteroate synthase [Cocleimonas sp.]
MQNKSPLIMGILNVTPDSFSDGGAYLQPDHAVQHALKMVAERADIIDVGGESTRPGADIVDEQLQLERVLPVIKKLRQYLDKNTLISIDTTSSTVADAALSAGADWINDVSAGEDSPDMFKLAAERKAPIILMHRQGLSATMQDNPCYIDVVDEVVDYLQTRAKVAESAGVLAQQIILDPGIGFGKSFEHNLMLMANLSAVVELTYPVLLGASRKRFLSDICQRPSGNQLAAATCATTTVGVLAGVQIFRVHDVFENRQAADVARQMIMA